MFVSAVSGLFLKMIYHRASMVVHLLQLKFSMVLVNLSLELSMHFDDVISFPKLNKK